MAKAMYILILVWVGVMALLESGAKATVMRYEIVEGKWERRWKKGWALFAWLPLIIWAGFRGYVGDTPIYMMEFSNMPSSLTYIPEYAARVVKDKGYYVGAAIIKCLIGNHVSLFFIIITFVQVLCVVKVYRKYSPEFATCFFLFIASADYISFIFNGMRQFIAVAITFACFEYILKKQYGKAIIGILFASLFHRTALLVVPFVFICQGQAWNKKTIMMLIASLLAVAFVGRFTSFLDTALQNTQYRTVITDITVGDFKDDDGTNPIRVFVYSIPAILSFFGRKKLKRENSRILNLCANMSIVSMGLYLISMVTSGIMMGRLPIYFSLYGYLLLPWELKNILPKGVSSFSNYGMVGAYLLYYLYSVHFQFGLI